MGLPELKLAIRGTRRGSKASSIQSPESEDSHPMIKSRKRSLTIPLSTPAKVGLTKRTLQKTNDQEQCFLLKLLPYEIRLMIWELVLGGFHLHIFNWTKLGHQTCQTLEESSFGVRHACLFRSPVDEMTKTVIHGAPQKFLPLLRTCRRIYSEAIDVLYTRNVFDFNNVRYRIDGLSKYMLPHRWESIREVSLVWYFKSSKLDARIPIVAQDWDRSCAALASMSGLNKLSVGLITETLNVEKSHIFEMLGPLEFIKVKGSFRVYVSWEENKNAEGAEKVFSTHTTAFELHRIPLSVSRVHSEKIHTPYDPGSMYRP